MLRSEVLSTFSTHVFITVNFHVSTQTFFAAETYSAFSALVLTSMNIHVLLQ